MNKYDVLNVWVDWIKSKNSNFIINLKQKDNGYSLTAYISKRNPDQGVELKLKNSFFDEMLISIERMNEVSDRKLTKHEIIEKYQNIFDKKFSSDIKSYLKKSEIISSGLSPIVFTEKTSDKILQLAKKVYGEEYEKILLKKSVYSTFEFKTWVISFHKNASSSPIHIPLFQFFTHQLFNKVFGIFPEGNMNLELSNEWSEIHQEVFKEVNLPI